MIKQHIKCTFNGKTLLIPKGNESVNINTLQKDLQSIYNNIERSQFYVMMDNYYIDPFNHLDYFSNSEKPLKFIKKSQIQSKDNIKPISKVNVKKKSNKRSKFVCKQQGIGYRAQYYEYYKKDMLNLSFSSVEEYEQAIKWQNETKKYKKQIKIIQKEIDNMNNFPISEFPNQQNIKQQSEDSQILKMIFQSSFQDVPPRQNQQIAQNYQAANVFQQQKPIEQSFSLTYPKQQFDCNQQKNTQNTQNKQDIFRQHTRKLYQNFQKIFKYWNEQQFNEKKKQK